MAFARLRYLAMFWIWVALLGVYLLGGTWLLYRGARAQATSTPTMLTAQVAGDQAQAVAHNE